MRLSERDDEVADAVWESGLPEAQILAIARAYLRASGMNPLGHTPETIRLRRRVLWGLQSPLHRADLVAWYHSQERRETQPP